MSVEFEEQVTGQTEIYRKLGQGIKIFHEHESPDVDILAVPGLGTNPEECWTWRAEGRSKKTKSTTIPEFSEASKGAKSQFNWLRDSDGLAALFPKSRIMLYDYASAWIGRHKVRATMKHICTWLLDDLTERRKGAAEVTRPLILIGHSMGGIVIAKTLCMARNQRQFDAIITCTVGCAFFGVPFRGSSMARIALLYSCIFGNDAYDSLINFMRAEKNDTLDEITNDFMEISKQLAPSIELLCAYEQVPTAVAYSDQIVQKLPSLMQHKAFKASARAVFDLGGAAFNSGTHFVDMESAVLQGAHSLGVTANHSDLIKFASIDAKEFLPVRVHLSSMVRMAKTNARKRSLLSGQNLLTQRTVSQVRESLLGVDMRLKFRTVVKQSPAKSWLISDPLYKEWLFGGAANGNNHPMMWLKGGPGLGKTNASLAAIQDIGDITSSEQQTATSVNQSGSFLAYFLCESAPGCCTAEELLKSLITQIIDQDDSLAQHGARWFIPNSRYRGRSHHDGNRAHGETGAFGPKATATVDNLWKCLQDMMDDPAVNSIHLVISNIHTLESGASTTALLSKLTEHIVSLDQQQISATRRTKWFVTSRNDSHISQCLTAHNISIVDLENDHEYGAKVKDARQKHARDAVAQLRESKNYSSELAFIARTSIQRQSEDETGIDILRILLEALPDDSSNSTIKKYLNEFSSYNTSAMIDHAWKAILSRNEDTKLEIEELMMALTIAYEPPSLADLDVLTHGNDPARVKQLVQKCSPIIKLSESGEYQGKVIFTNPKFRERLRTVLLGPADNSNPQIRQRHSLMALGCFKYIQEHYNKASKRGRFADVAQGLMRATSVRLGRDDRGNLHDLTYDDEDADDRHMVSTMLQTSNPACTYPVKYLFRHLSEGSSDVVSEVCDENPQFWGYTSRLRNAWLRDFQALTTDLKDLNTNGMSALHVAAGIGAVDLISILVGRNGKEALSWKSDDGMTALHVAAFNNHADVVDTLIQAEANIEAGEDEAGTALHLAALRGNCSIMALLIQKRANVNASSRDSGPVINAAIRSGNVDAVKQIMDEDVRFDLDYTKCVAPLSLAAEWSEPALFREILETGREKWLQNAKLLDQALEAASYNGRLESLRILLGFPHTYTNNTLEQAIFSAAREKKWSSVNELLDYAIKDSAEGNRRDVRLDDAFYLAATSREERLDVLEKMWAFSNHGIPQEMRDFSLYQATVLRKDDTVIWLLETCKANANATAERYGTVALDSANVTSAGDFSNVLNAAAGTGNLTLVKSLLDNGADVDGETVYALQLAASEGHTEVVVTLVKRGAELNRQVPNSEDLGFFSSTALQAACENNRTETVQALLAHGADPNLGGGVLSNPITAATQRAHSDILGLLLDAPSIDVNRIGGEDQSTPLINASKHMSTESVQLLLQKGADPNARNAAGDTPLIMAALRGDQACVNVLCDSGADVTYRSPHRGLPIQVAAEGLHPGCAHILAEKMGGTIEDHRQNGILDLKVAREQLQDSLAELAARDETIDGLNAELAETREQLEISHREIETRQHDKEEQERKSSLRGETYEHMSQRVKAMEDDRMGLLKQLSAADGQAKIADDTVTRLRGQLGEEKTRNAELRERQGWAKLQEEKQHALDMVQQEKNAAVERSIFEKEQRDHLHDEIQALKDTVGRLEQQIDKMKESANFAAKKFELERREKEDLQNQVRTLEEAVREKDETIASVQLAAARNKTPGPEIPPASGSSDVPANPDYFPRQNGRASGSEKETYFLEETAGESPRGPVASPLQSSPVNSPDISNGRSMSPRNQPSSPYMSRRSPAQSSEGVFHTVHGRHRADGSFGGYPPDLVRRRVTSENVYNPAVQQESVGQRSMSTDSLRSNGSSRRSTGKLPTVEDLDYAEARQQQQQQQKPRPKFRAPWG